MSLGTSDGQQFDSYMDMFSSQNEQNSRPVTQQNPGNSFGIDRNHHVPLVASAILDDAGQPTGDIAIDHRIPPKPEYEPYLHLHEMSEMYHMNNLMKSGMSPQDAYHEAHDKIATPIESAAVKADMGEDGLEAYKKYWREAASVAAEPTDKPRHPQAHTTVHKLDEGEGVYQAPTMLASFAGIGAKTADRTLLNHAQSMEQLGKSPKDIFQTTNWYRGAEGRWKFELPSDEAKLKYKPTEGSDRLSGILDYPSLYKAYPELAKLKVQMDPEMEAIGSFDGQTITLNPKKLDKPGMKNTLMHEIQHWIQHKEGFDTGSNPEKSKAELDIYNYDLAARNPTAAVKLLNEKQKAGDKLPYELYKNRPGEIEAELAAVRSGWNPVEKYQETPLETSSRVGIKEIRIPGFDRPAIGASVLEQYNPKVPEGLQSKLINE